MGRKATGILLGASMFASIYQLFCCSPEGDLLKPLQIVLRTALHLATLLREEHDCLIVRVSIGVQRVKYLSSNRLQCSTMDVSIIGKRLLHRLCSEWWECCLSVTFSGAKKWLSKLTASRNSFSRIRTKARSAGKSCDKTVAPLKVGVPQSPHGWIWEPEYGVYASVSFLETLNINYWLHHVTSLPFNLKIFPIHIHIYIYPSWFHWYSLNIWSIYIYII